MLKPVVTQRGGQQRGEGELARGHGGHLSLQQVGHVQERSPGARAGAGAEAAAGQLLGGDEAARGHGAAAAQQHRAQRRGLRGGGEVVVGEAGQQRVEAATQLQVDTLAGGDPAEVESDLHSVES